MKLCGHFVRYISQNGCCDDLPKEALPSLREGKKVRKTGRFGTLLQVCGEPYEDVSKCVSM